MLNNKKLTMSITTCKRLPYFKTTMQSVLNCFEDLHLVDEFILVDDSSTEEDRAYMKQWCSQHLKMPVEFLFYDHKGLPFSLYFLYRHLKKNGTDYLLHLEDDWLFRDRMPYISKAATLFELPDVKQVVYTAYTHFYDPRNLYGLYDKILNKSVHKDVPYLTSTIDNWSTNPALIAFKEMYERAGDFSLQYGRNAEMGYRRKYHKAGMKMVFLGDCHVDNIGAEVSAFTMNDIYPATPEEIKEKEDFLRAYDTNRVPAQNVDL